MYFFIKNQFLKFQKPGFRPKVSHKVRFRHQNLANQPKTFFLFFIFRKKTLGSDHLIYSVQNTQSRSTLKIDDLCEENRFFQILFLTNMKEVILLIKRLLAILVGWLFFHGNYQVQCENDGLTENLHHHHWKIGKAASEFKHIALAEDLGNRSLLKGKVNLERIAKNQRIRFIEGNYGNHFFYTNSIPSRKWTMFPAETCFSGECDSGTLPTGDGTSRDRAPGGSAGERNDR